MTYVILASWFICSVLSYGYHLACYQRSYPSLANSEYNRDRLYALSLSLFGPVSLFTTFLLDQNKYGLMFSRDTSSTNN